MSQSIYVIIFLIVLLMINSVLSQNVLEKFYVNSTPLPLTIYKFTGRDLIFPHMGDAKFTAADRAQFDNTITTIPEGKSPILMRDELDASYAVVKENGIYYTLKKARMALTMDSYRFDNDEQMITISFPLDTDDNVNNMAKFLLINPLFVEIGEGMNLSLAYVPQPFKRNYTERGFYYTNSTGYNQKWRDGFYPSKIDIRFRVAVPLNKGSCDTTFDYNSPDNKKYQLSDTDLKLFKRNKMINMWVYYLDDLNVAFQATNRTLSIEPSANGHIQLFNKNFRDMSSDSTKIETFNFMNTIYNMYTTYTVPVFTFTFDFKMKQSIKNNSEKIQLMKCWVGNGFYGGWSPCNNNVMQITIEPREDFVELQFTIGDGSDCGYKSWFAPPAILYLPWLTDGTIVNITAIFGINQKHIFAEWKDINKGDIGKKFAYAKSHQNFLDPPYNSCTRYDETIHREINNFTKIFGSQKYTVDNRPKLENINLTWDTTLIDSVKNISLGYENLYNKFAGPK